MKPSVMTGARRILAADRGDAGRRIDLVVQRHLTGVPGASRTGVQRWIRDGRVAVNGRRVGRVAARTVVGDLVTVDLPERSAVRAIVPEPLPIEVVFEDEYLAVVSKPAGQVSHPTYKHPSGTLLNALMWRARSWPLETRPSLVGRLDRLTSGLVIVAKTRAVHRALQRALTASSACKAYLAVVYGRVAGSGSIDFPLGRDRGDRRRVTVTRNGLPSRTRFERLDWVAAPRAGLALVRCELGTGRMHQIRVHLAARGWPIVGDPTYGEPRWSTVDDPHLSAALQAFPRQALHCWRLAFTHPVTREPVTLTADPPTDLADLLAAAALRVPHS
jgi:23S rRNA pseudouridine1911/1915/1917 synthase